MAEWLVGCNVLEGGWKDPSPASELSPGRGRTNGTAVQLDEDLRSPRQVQQTDWDSSSMLFSQDDQMPGVAKTCTATMSAMYGWYV